MTSDPPRSKAVNELRSAVYSALERPARELQEFEWDNVTGTSGTILAIGNALQLQSAGEPAHTVIRLRDLSEFNNSLASMTVAERKHAARLPIRRAGIIVAGGLVLEGTMRALGIKSLSTCGWALREGVIIDRLLSWRGVLSSQPAGRARAKAPAR